MNNNKKITKCPLMYTKCLLSTPFCSRRFVADIHKIDRKICLNICLNISYPLEFRAENSRISRGFRANFARISRAHNTRKLLTNCIDILKNTIAKQNCMVSCCYVQLIFWKVKVIQDWCSIQDCRCSLLNPDPVRHTLVVVNENQLFNKCFLGGGIAVFSKIQCCKYYCFALRPHS